MAELIPPSRCKGKLPEEFSEWHVAEEKIDGSRYVLYLGNGVDPYGRQKGNTLLSRRESTVDGKHVDKTKNVPHITSPAYPESLQDTVIDGEIFLGDFQTTASIMGSGSGTAIAKQEDAGYVLYRAFDCMVFRGQDIRGLALEKRRRILEEVVARMDNEHVVAIPQWTEGFQKHFHDITDKGGEGLIIKDIRMGYGVGWAKMKKAYEVSAFITGFKNGNGKFAEQVGSLELSVYHEGGTVYIGHVSGFDDQTRARITENKEEYLGKVLDVNTMRLNKPSADFPLGRLFQPTFHRWRDDYNKKECTYEKLIADLRKKAKNSRKKIGI